MDNQPPTKGDEKMCKTTTVNPNNARKGEIPDAWKKVRAIQRSFDMRAGGHDVELDNKIYNIGYFRIKI